MSKFWNNYEQLQKRIACTGIGGVWRDLGNQKQYRAETGAILNWWQSTNLTKSESRTREATQLW